MTRATAIDTAGDGSSRENNFRIIRHSAAVAVILSHSFVLTLGIENLGREPLKAATGISFAEIAVNIFFVVSGFLVAQSIMSRRSLVAYAISRILRIYPALITVVCLTAFVLGPILTTLPLAEYFGAKSVYGYVVYNSAALHPLGMRFSLPGVFEDHPYPGVVNASLWTLPWEVWMYIVLALLFLTRLLRPRGRFVILWSGVMVVHLVIAFGLFEPSAGIAIAVRFLSYFFTGSLFFICRDRLRLTTGRQIIFTTVFVLWALVLRNDALLPFFLAHTTLFLSLYPPLVARRFCDGPDLSYGVYLYAYPVQQVLVSLMGRHDPYLNAALSLALTLPLAALSWYLVEKPALGLKGRLITWAGTASCRLHGRLPVREANR